MNDELGKFEGWARENRELRQKVNNVERRLDALSADLDARIEAAVKKAITPLHKEIAIRDEKIEKTNEEIARLKASKDEDSGELIQAAEQQWI